MKKTFPFGVLCAALIFFACFNPEKKENSHNLLTQQIPIFSKAVQDSFFLSIQLPEDYFKESQVKYPTVYVLDANFHFPILAAAIKEYEKAGLLPPIILIGIGYKSFKLMDSLRVRDYLYPAALPSDEMTAVGGGKNFDECIKNQIVPHIDSVFQTDKSNRALLGHSFGGYFALYTLLNQAQTNQMVFKNIASASPSLWYNNFYLNQLTDKLKGRSNKDTLNIYMTVGGLEEPQWNVLPVKKLGEAIRPIKDVKCQYKIYNDLEHMDVATISFIKALQEFYGKSK
jgi:uncharacterized protein